MNRFGILLLGAAAMAQSAIGCSDSNTTGDAATGNDAVVTDRPSTGDGSSCGMPATPDGGRTPFYQCASGPVCPSAHIANNAMSPNFRLTYLEIVQPAALANAAVQGAVNPTLQRGSFLWGLSINLTANTFKTGALNPMTRTLGNVGVGLLDGTFQYFNNNATGMGMPNRYDPISGALMMANNHYSTATVMGTVQLPIFNDDGSILTTLPLSNASLSSIALTADRGCIGEGRPQGGRFTETSSPWNTTDDANMPYGTVDADITVEAARTVNVTLGGMAVPLCDLLAGAACSTAMGTWPNQPMMVGGMPSYHLKANFAAVAANITQ